MNDKHKQIAYSVKIIIEIGILLFAVAVAWSTLKGRVDFNTTAIEKQDVRIATTEKGLFDVRSDIREIKIEQKYISQGIDEIKKELKN